MKKQEIEKVAELAKLELTDEEKVLFSSELNGLLAHFNQLNSSLNFNHQPENLNSNNSFLREDVSVSFSEESEKLVNLAPESQGRLYKVPAVL